MAEEKKDTMMAMEVRQTGELAVSYDQARAQKEIEGAIVLSKRFPRDEMTMLTRIQRACQRPAFAEKARYVFPRGGAEISGPSVNLAREMARLWGNIRFGLEVMRDDDDSRKVRAFAWDMESNTTVYSETEFKKLIYRKKEGWVVPDERDLRELTNKHGAIAVRNCILQLIPPDFIEDAMNECKQTLRGTLGKGRDEILKKLVKAFDELAITPAMIEARYGYKIAALTEDDIDELRGIFESIKDGNSKRDEHFGAKKMEVETGAINLADLKPAKAEVEPPTPIVEKLKEEFDAEVVEPETAVPWDQIKKIPLAQLTEQNVLDVVNMLNYPLTGADPKGIRKMLPKYLKAAIEKLEAWEKEGAK
jgi:hypothetical protein